MRRVPWIAALAVGCGADLPVSGSSVASSATTTGVSEDPVPSQTTLVAEASEDDEGSVFLGYYDADPADGCDPFAQNCPAGHKCTHVANDGGPAWNSTACVDVVPDPAPAGDPCSMVGSPTSGIDDCDVGLMCFFVDDDGHGTCIELCWGSADAPICRPGRTCAQSGGGLALCIPDCDPLLQSCPPGQACYPIDHAFACAPDASGRPGLHGDPCRYLNSCDPGFTCIGPDAHSECASGVGCCSKVCDLDDRNADPDCAALDPAQTCVPWFAQGFAPPGYENVGVCAIPR